VFFAALLTSGCTILPIRSLALRLGVVDKPDTTLKRHQEPVAYMGGVAVYLGLVAAFVTANILTDGDFVDRTSVSFMIGGLAILVLGLLDDAFRMSVYFRLVVHAFVAIFIVRSGVSYHVFGMSWLDNPLSVLWIVFTLNSLNIIDIMNGLASSAMIVAAACALALLVVSGLGNDHVWVMVMLAALIGALAGFLPFNFPKAKIYLGDAGSTLIGYAMGVNLMAVAWNEAPLYDILVSAIILTVPLFDTCLVVIKRLDKGMSPFHGSDDHFAVRLRQLGIGVERIVGIAVLFGLSSGAVAAAIWLATWPFKLAIGFMWAFFMTVMGFLVSVRGRRRAG
jgi:UDP-GlcNAc:undecaprenyl-phosphate GlcNAc-1-phosphate transferase